MTTPIIKTCTRQKFMDIYREFGDQDAQVYMVHIKFDTNFTDADSIDINFYSLISRLNKQYTDCVVTKEGANIVKIQRVNNKPQLPPKKHFKGNVRRVQ
jgi:hypothetical protein